MACMFFFGEYIFVWADGYIYKSVFLRDNRRLATELWMPAELTLLDVTAIFRFKFGESTESTSLRAYRLPNQPFYLLVHYFYSLKCSASAS